MQIKLNISKQKFTFIVVTLLTLGILLAIFYPREPVLTLFINDSCPHCEQTVKHIDSLEFYKRVKVEVKNIDSSYENRHSFEEALGVCNLREEEIAVPLLHSSDKCFKGTTRILQELEKLSISS